MIDIGKLGARFIFGITIGGYTIKISESTCWVVIASVLIFLLCLWLGSGLQKVPKGKQIFAEAFVRWVYGFTEKNLGKQNIAFAPYVGSLFLFIFIASSFGLIGFRPITADLNVTGALALLSFIMIIGNQIRRVGFKGFLKDFVTPYPFMLPIKIIEKLTLPLTLALRLFGNIFGGMIVIELWMHLMEYLSGLFMHVPVLRAVLVLPLNFFFDMFEPAVQTYIFTMLTVVNLKLALGDSKPKEEHTEQRLAVQKEAA